MLEPVLLFPPCACCAGPPPMPWPLGSANILHMPLFLLRRSPCWSFSGVSAYTHGTEAIIRNAILFRRYGHTLSFHMKVPCTGSGTFGEKCKRVVYVYGQPETARVCLRRQREVTRLCLVLSRAGNISDITTGGGKSHTLIIFACFGTHGGRTVKLLVHALRLHLHWWFCFLN